MSERALNLISKNKKNKNKKIDLGNCNLGKIPDELGELTWLEELILSNEWSEYDSDSLGWEKVRSQNEGKKNYITDINFNFSKLKKLKKIIISGTLGRTKRWPIYDFTCISELAQLEFISCSHTDISNLAPFSNLKQLKFLDIRDTLVEDLSPLSNLNMLQSIYCRDSKIEDVSPLSNLTELQHLSFSYTKVYDLSCLYKLTKLKSLHVRQTNVKDISFALNMKKLEYLDLSNTDVSDLYPLNKAEELKTLIIVHTKVKSISPLEFHIKKGLDVQYSAEKGNIRIFGCEITNPPIEIIKQGSQAILNFIDEIKKAKENNEIIKLAEAKCLILGEGGAGKTSLTLKLMDKNNKLPQEEDTTKGINIHSIKIKLNEDNDFSLNFWDFGGQEIYHATHQFFLTKRSIYILLDDTRKDENTVNDPTFNYWLQIAALYGGNSPLLIVQNEKGDRSKELDLNGIKGQFTFVKGVRATNLLTGRGLDQVWKAIRSLIQELPHLGEEQPKAWAIIRKELESLKKDHISLEEYVSICKKNKIEEIDRAMFLSSYLHDFGAFLHFQTHPLLKKLIVLNNRWATSAVYSVLDSEYIKRSNGHFTRKTLKQVWDNDQYINYHDELIALMEKFELCYKIPNINEDKWIAPQLLSIIEPSELEEHLSSVQSVSEMSGITSNVMIRYEYDFMPRGILSRHIVRMHRFISDSKFVWKTGVVFNRHNSACLVREEWGKRYLALEASGMYGKELLLLLCEDIELIHSQLEGIKVRKMIPCYCVECVKSKTPEFYNHNSLMRRKEKGKLTVECGLSFEDIDVNILLDGIKTIVQNENETKDCFSIRGECSPILFDVIKSHVESDSIAYTAEFQKCELVFLSVSEGMKYNEIRAEFNKSIFCFCEKESYSEELSHSFGGAIYIYDPKEKNVFFELIDTWMLLKK